MIPLPLETQRLILREFAPADADAMAEVYLDPEVMRYVVGGGLADPAAVAAVLDREIASQASRGFAFWAVVERSTGRVVGDAGFGIFEPLDALEVGWTLARDAWGRGYATEAARACLAAAFAHLDVDEIVAAVDEQNAASLRVAEKLGFAPYRRIAILGRPHAVLVCRRGE